MDNIPHDVYKSLKWNQQMFWLHDDVSSVNLANSSPAIRFRTIRLVLHIPQDDFDVIHLSFDFTGSDTTRIYVLGCLEFSIVHSEFDIISVRTFYD
jgi:hypothetical protein